MAHDTEKTERTATPPTEATRQPWHKPEVRVLGVATSEATPGGNAEGDGTS
jgi:hypothetical protein